MPANPTPHVVLRGFQPKHFAVIKPGATVPLEESRTETTITATPSLTPIIASVLTSPHATTPVKRLPVARVAAPTARLKPMVKVGDMRLIQPDLARFISMVPFKEKGVPRNKIKVPVSLNREVSDSILLEEPTDSTKKLYIPRYRLAEKKVSGKTQFRVSLEQKDQGGTLSIFLEKYPAEELGEKSRDAAEINHAFNIKLKYHISIGSSGSAESILDFQEYTEVEEWLKATLDINNLSELTQVFQAITNTDFKTTLIINRVVKVAIPIDIKPQVDELKKQVTKLQNEINTLKVRETSFKNQLKTMQASLPKINTQISNLNKKITAENKKKTETQKQLSALKKQLKSIPALPMMAAPRNAILAQIRALESSITAINQKIKSLSSTRNSVSNQVRTIKTKNIPQINNSIKKTTSEIKSKNQALSVINKKLRELQSTPLFRETTKTLEQVIKPQPFVFPKDLHPYVTQSVTGSSSDQKYGLVRHRVNWGNNSYSYFQSQTQTNLFYYLPDSFKIARRPESPHYPIMSAQCTEKDDSSQEVQAVLEYVAVPHVDSARLEAAEEKLKKYLDEPSEDVSMEFQPLQGVDPDKVKFKLALPRSDTSEGPYKERSGAIVTLKGIQDRLTLSLEDFRAIYDALFGGSSVLFQGNVEIDLGEDESSELIPFVARLDDFSGELLDYKEVPNEETGGVTANLKNAIESPIEITELKASFNRNGESFQADIKDLTLPVELQPGEEVEFDVIPTASIPGEEPLTVIFEFEKVKVKPDSEKVLNVIFDPSISAHPSKDIKVQTVPGIFEPPEQETLLVAVDVVFEGGETVEFTSQNCPKGNQICSEEIEINLPLSDYILGKVNEGEYRYCVTVIKSDGTSIGTVGAKDTWKKAYRDILWIQTTDIPSGEG